MAWKKEIGTFGEPGWQMWGAGEAAYSPEEAAALGYEWGGTGGTYGRAPTTEEYAGILEEKLRLGHYKQEQQRRREAELQRLRAGRGEPVIPPWGTPKRWHPYITAGEFKAPEVRAFEARWAGKIKDSEFTGDVEEYNDYRRDRNAALEAQERAYGTYSLEQEMRARRARESYEGALREQSQRAWESGAFSMGRAPEPRGELPRTPWGKVSDWVKEIDRKVSGTRPITAMKGALISTKRAMPEEMRDWPVPHEFSFGEIEGTLAKPATTAGIFGVSAAMPAAFRGAGRVISPVSRAAGQVFPKAGPFIAKWAPRALGAGLTGGYGVSVEERLRKAPAGARAGLAGEIYATEILPMAEGFALGDLAIRDVRPYGKLQRSRSLKSRGLIDRVTTPSRRKTITREVADLAEYDMQQLGPKITKPSPEKKADIETLKRILQDVKVLDNAKIRDSAQVEALYEKQTIEDIFRELGGERPKKYKFEIDVGERLRPTPSQKTARGIWEDILAKRAARRGETNILKVKVEEKSGLMRELLKTKEPPSKFYPEEISTQAPDAWLESELKKVDADVSLLGEVKVGSPGRVYHPKTYYRARARSRTGVTTTPPPVYGHARIGPERPPTSIKRISEKIPAERPSRRIRFFGAPFGLLKNADKKANALILAERQAIGRLSDAKTQTVPRFALSEMALVRELQSTDVATAAITKTKTEIATAIEVLTKTGIKAEPKIELRTREVVRPKIKTPIIPEIKIVDIPPPPMQIIKPIGEDIFRPRKRAKGVKTTHRKRGYKLLTPEEMMKL